MSKGRALLLLCAVQLASCHGDSSGTPVVRKAPTVKAPAAVPPGPSPEQLTAGMVEAVTMGKSTVPVAVKFDLPQRPVVGQPFELVLAVMPQIAADNAVLVVSGADGLPVTSGAGPVDMPMVEPKQVYRHNVAITPTAEGVQLLGLSVALKHDDVTETRTFSVPLVVAPRADAPADATSRTTH
jgi:hypothetical protein